ncbi:hypothetical protein [Sulfitobacter sp. 1A13679]|uniref:hypothetical protein n=1 Tax=Sulfitobacter sp. 1A13679 TaxID=3368597 RepID=UPI003746E920
MTRKSYVTLYDFEPNGNQTPEFASAYYCARYSLERVEIDAWFDRISEFLTSAL